MIGCTDHDQAHAVAGGLADDGRVCVIVQVLLELVVDLRVIGGHGDEAETQAHSMLYGLILAAVSEAVSEIVDFLLGILILMDQTIGEVGTSRGVRGVLLVWNAGSGKVGVEDGESFLLVA